MKPNIYYNTFYTKFHGNKDYIITIKNIISLFNNTLKRFNNKILSTIQFLTRTYFGFLIER